MEIINGLIKMNHKISEYSRKQLAKSKASKIDSDDPFGLKKLEKLNEKLAPIEYHTGLSFEDFMKKTREFAKQINDQWSDHWDDGISYYATDTEDDIILRRLHKQFEDDWMEWYKESSALCHEILDQQVSRVYSADMTHNAYYNYCNIDKHHGDNKTGYFDYTTEAGLKNIVATVIYKMYNKTKIVPFHDQFVGEVTGSVINKNYHKRSDYLNNLGLEIGEERLPYTVLLGRDGWTYNVIMALLVNDQKLDAQNFTSKYIEFLNNKVNEIETKVNKLDRPVLEKLWDQIIKKYELDEKEVDLRYKVESELRTEYKSIVFVPNHIKEERLNKVQTETDIINKQKRQNDILMDLFKLYDLDVDFYENIEDLFNDCNIKPEYVFNCYIVKLDLMFAEKKYRTDDYLRLLLRQDDTDYVVGAIDTNKKFGQPPYPTTLAELYAYQVMTLAPDKKDWMFDITFSEEIHEKGMEYWNDLVAKTERYLEDDAKMTHPTREALRQTIREMPLDYTYSDKIILQKDVTENSSEEEPIKEESLIEWLERASADAEYRRTHGITDP